MSTDICAHTGITLVALLTPVRAFRMGIDPDYPPFARKCAQ